jgi:transposase
VLPYCNLYLRLQLVLIFNNAFIHKDKRLKQLCNKAKVLLLFLPPYLLDFNLIKATFKNLKV